MPNSCNHILFLQCKEAWPLRSASVTGVNYHCEDHFVIHLGQLAAVWLYCDSEKLKQIFVFLSIALKYGRLGVRCEHFIKQCIINALNFDGMASLINTLCWHFLNGTTASNMIGFVPDYCNFICVFISGTCFKWNMYFFGPVKSH